MVTEYLDSLIFFIQGYQVDDECFEGGNITYLGFQLCSVFQWTVKISSIEFPGAHGDVLFLISFAKPRNVSNVLTQVAKKQTQKG